MTCLRTMMGLDRDCVIKASDGRHLSAAELVGLEPTVPLAESSGVALRVADSFELLRILVALDGRVRQLLLLSAGLPDDTAKALAEQVGCTIFTTGSAPALRERTGVLHDAEEPQFAQPIMTRWLMTTSGTTGIPKIVPHTLASLCRSVYRFPAGQNPVWGLLYEPTRFAGLQVVLQALIGGGTLVLADRDAPLADQVASFAAQGVTHLSATPTLWRRLLMVQGHQELPLRQVTLGGEIVDQPVLNALRKAYPKARITHIYASTEAGVGFSVTDGQAGFPESYLAGAPGGVRLRVRDGILWLRPPGAISGQAVSGVDRDSEGYIRSGDRVETRSGRVLFRGRDDGVINVGGVKVHPETVEAVIGAVPGVALVHVSARRNPVTGALVEAAIQPVAGMDREELRLEIQATCRSKLPREAMPAILRFVETFETNAAGKLVRRTSR